MNRFHDAAVIRRTALASVFGAALAASPLMASQGMTGVIYGLDQAPDGSFLFTQNQSVMEWRKGQVSEIVTLPTAVQGDAVAPVNGISVLGRGNFFVTTGGLDATEGAALWRISRGNARLVADIAAWEMENDPDNAWYKDHACEAIDGFSPGPQTNPYQIEALSGGEVLIADAAGNSVLIAGTNGEIDWVALPPPIYDPEKDPELPDEERWMPQYPEGFAAPGVTCYVQPVPTSVAVGPDGAYYFGELTGTPPLYFDDEGEPVFDPTSLAGTARIWRVESDARNVRCPSEACRKVAGGLTSIMDIGFGPDGRLYAVELDELGWLPAVMRQGIGGSVQACDVETGACETIESDISAPSAMTFDDSGRLWIVESMFFEPVIREVVID